MYGVIKVFELLTVINEFVSSNDTLLCFTVGVRVVGDENILGENCGVARGRM